MEVNFNLLVSASRRLDTSKEENVLRVLRLASDFLLEFLTELALKDELELSDYNLDKGTLSFISSILPGNPSSYFYEPNMLVGNYEGFSDYTKVQIIKTEIDEEIKTLSKKGV